MLLNSPESLPEVQAVTGLMIRRQLRHQISSMALQLPWEKLPRLEDIVYELWRYSARLEMLGDHGMLLYRAPFNL